MPELEQTGENQKGENKALNQIGDAAENQQLHAIHPVGDDAADGTKDKARCKLKKTKQAQVECRMSQLPSQPVLHDKMNILAGLGRKVTEGKAAKLRVAQCRGTSHVMKEALSTNPSVRRRCLAEPTILRGERQVQFVVCNQ